MTGLTFDAFTRQLGRRRALQALGAVAVAATSGFTLAAAKNGKSNNGNNKQQNKKQKRKIQKQSLALCAGQTEECNALIATNCNDDAECLASGQQCCQLLATCDFAGLLTCLQSSTAN